MYGAYILDMPIGFALRLIRKAIEEKAEARAWQLYCAVSPHMTKNSYKTFEQFYPRKKALKSRQVTQAELDRFSDIADLRRSRKARDGHI